MTDLASDMSSAEYRSHCFLSLPQSFGTVRDGLKRAVESVGGDTYFVIVSEGDTLRNEIVRGLTSSAILIADLSSASDNKKAVKGPRPAIMWEIGYAEAVGMGMVFICQNADRANTPSVLTDYHIIYYDLDEIEPMIRDVEGALEKIIAREKTGGSRVFRARCYLDRNSCDLEVRYLRARKTIKILELNLDTVEPQAPTIIRAAERNPELSVQILTLNPFSKFAIDRADQLAELPQSYRRQLYLKIQNTHERLTTLNEERWGLRIYDTFPTQIMFQVDEALIHSVIVLGKRSRHMLHFEVQRSRPNAADTFESHFAQLWSQSVTYEKWRSQNKKAIARLMGEDKSSPADAIQGKRPQRKKQK